MPVRGSSSTRCLRESEDNQVFPDSGYFLQLVILYSTISVIVASIWRRDRRPVLFREAVPGQEQGLLGQQGLWILGLYSFDCSTIGNSRVTGQIIPSEPRYDLCHRQVGIASYRGSGIRATSPPEMNMVSRDHRPQSPLLYGFYQSPSGKSGGLRANRPLAETLSSKALDLDLWVQLIGASTE